MAVKRKKVKVLHVIIKFDPTLQKSGALGKYFFISKKNNTAVIVIDPESETLELIDTFYHEFTHFIKDLLLNKDNFKKYFQITYEKAVCAPTVKTVEFKPTTLETEEELCEDMGAAGKKRFRKFLDASHIKK